MKEIHDLLEQARRRNEDDAKRFEALDGDLCMACHAYGADKRSLIISCGYDVSEVIPDAIKLHSCPEKLGKRGWYLLVCKSCRAALLGLLAEWWNERVNLREIPKDHDGYLDSDGSACIPVRQHGAVKMMTYEEWVRYRANHIQ